MADMGLDCRAVLLDLDGVLIDSTAAVERAWRRWAGEVGIDPAPVLAVAHGRRTVDTIRQVAPQVDAEAEAARIERREEAETAGIVAYAGTERFLAALPDDRWAVVTSAPMGLATARLRAAGLPLPPLLVPAEAVRAGKPDPQGYRAGALALGVAPAGCVVVEDAPAGVEAGRRAGMRVVAVTTTHAAGALAGADLVVGTLADLRVKVEPDGTIRLERSA